MRRREFITLLGGAAATWPFFAQGQEPGRIYHLGALLSSPRDAPHYVALFNELRRLGFIEGRNLVVRGRCTGAGLKPAPTSLPDLCAVSRRRDPPGTHLAAVNPAASRQARRKARAP